MRRTEWERGRVGRGGEEPLSTLLRLCDEENEAGDDMEESGVC